jgi:DNA-binding NtrC family response regulator
MKTLLIVNDNDTERASVVEFFRASGFRVVEASSSVDGIAEVIRQPIGAVIIKAQMSGLSGLDAAPIMKRIRPQVEVFLTAPESFHGPEETSKQVDFFTCFEEPLDLERMKTVIEND